MKLRAPLARSAMLFAAIASLPLTSTPALSANYTWDADATPPASGGTGTWDAVSNRWFDGSADSPWADGVDAFFPATAGTVTIPTGETRTANSLTFVPNAGNYVITGGTLAISDAAQSITMPTHTTTTLAGQVINAPISGTNITVYNTGTAAASGRTLLNLGGANTFTGNLILDGAATPSNANANSSNMVSIANATALPATASVVFKRNWSQLLFTAGTAAGGSNTAYTATFGNDLVLNPNNTASFNSIIGATAAGTNITLTGSISGTSDLSFQVGTNGGVGAITLNPSSTLTYTGATRLLSNTDGVLRIGRDNALPVGTALIFAGTAGNDGSFDLNGHNQTVGSLSSTTNAGTSPNLAYIGGIVNNTATLSTLTIDGSGTSKYDGPIGTPPPTTVLPTTPNPTTLTFSSNSPAATTNIALHLAATNLGTMILTNANNASITGSGYVGSNYTGGTTVDGGRLVVANTVGSATGNGPVTVGIAGTLASANGGSYGTVAGHVSLAGTLAPGVQLPTGLAGTALPSGATAAGTGILTLSGGLSASAGANLNFEINSSSNDKLVLGGATDADILSLPATPQSVNLNLTDSGLSNNTTYSLISYPNTTTLPGLDTSAAGPIKVNRPLAGLSSLATFTLSNNTATHTIDLAVSGTFGRKLSWRGDATGSGVWDINTTANFDLSGSPSTYLDPDEVTVDESSTPGTDPIVISIDPAGVFPANTLVTNASRSVTLQGGPIKNGALTKSGTGTLILAGSNSYAAGTTVNANGGVLAIASDASLGAVPAVPTVNLTLARSAAGGSTLRFDNDITLDPNRTILLVTSNGSALTFDTNGHNATIAGQILAAASVNIAKAGAGTLTLAGDNSTAAGGNFIGVVQINAGTVSAAQDVSLGRAGGGISFAASGGTFRFDASFNPVNRNVTVNSPGTIDTNGFDSTINGVVAGANTFTKSGSGTLTLSGTNTLTGATVVDGGTLLLRPLALAPVTQNAGGATINAGELILDYGASSSLPATTAAALKASHDSSNFTDPAQRYRTANTNDPAKGLGYLTDFASHTITILYTWYGDASLNGKIDPDDYALFDAAIAGLGSPSAGAGWQNGDFDYSGTTDAADALLLDTSLALSGGSLSPGLLSLRASQFGDAYVSSLLASVPEPISLAVCGLVLLPLTRRRR